VNVWVLAISLGAMLIAALVGAGLLWQASGVDIGVFGWSVIGGGAVITIALGAGLMWLSFHSARAGFDAAAHDASRDLAAPSSSVETVEK
jgi:hypothetical protein